ncbi:hypothetical protein [Streptococcus acidominimus]|uniref:Uncharacterized protein n=2 Tax=Streptococcus acidominimus TaxID=1326 RepID=A0A1Q8EDR8_STRAI|nr:hypothetical protein [Streptococcus acidominimus]OLF49910.1 hypothetical protein BU200_04870 [Streptococcus acidominimus]SUN07717.1 Uncharacterised protein [Streptococcus acidominimus]
MKQLLKLLWVKLNTPEDKYTTVLFRIVLLVGLSVLLPLVLGLLLVLGVRYEYLSFVFNYFYMFLILTAVACFLIKYILVTSDFIIGILFFKETKKSD